MTGWQEKKIEDIRNYIEEHDLFGDPTEWSFKVNELPDGVVEVHSEAVIVIKDKESKRYERIIRNIHIGTKGGLTAIVIRDTKSKKLIGWSSVMRDGCQKTIQSVIKRSKKYA